MKFESDITDALSSIKRLYADLDIKLPCPNCGEEVLVSSDYISYASGTLYFYCADGCEHEWEIESTLTASLTVEIPD